MDEFEAPPPQAGGDDPFGMGGGESYAPPPPLEGGGDMGMMGGGMAPSEPLPTFGEPEPAPAMGGGMDMGGMDMGGMGGMGSAPVGGLGDEFNTEMGPVAQWRLEREEKLAARPWCQKARETPWQAARVGQRLVALARWLLAPGRAWAAPPPTRASAFVRSGWQGGRPLVTCTRTCPPPPPPPPAPWAKPPSRTDTGCLCAQAKKAESDAALKTKIEEAQGALATFYSELKTKSEKRAAENLCALRPPHTPRWVSVCTRLAPHRPCSDHLRLAAPGRAAHRLRAPSLGSQGGAGPVRHGEGRRHPGGLVGLGLRNGQPQGSGRPDGGHISHALDPCAAQAQMSRTLRHGREQRSAWSRGYWERGVG